MSFDDAVAELDRLLVAAQALVGGEWQVNDGGAEECPLLSGDVGASAPLSRIGRGVPADRQRELIAEVGRVWAAAGFSATVIDAPTIAGIEGAEVNYPGAGHDAAGVFLRLETSTTATRVSGQTRCVPGDAGRINQEYQDSLVG